MNNGLRAFAVISAMAISATTGHAQELGNNTEAVQELNDQASLSFGESRSSAAPV
jgi:hypothetical protein